MKIDMVEFNDFMKHSSINDISDLHQQVKCLNHYLKFDPSFHSKYIELKQYFVDHFQSFDSYYDNPEFMLKCVDLSKELKKYIEEDLIKYYRYSYGQEISYYDTSPVEYCDLPDEIKNLIENKKINSPTPQVVFLYALLGV